MSNQEVTHRLSWIKRAKLLKRDVYTLYFALKDPRTPWYARVWISIVVIYAFSPIDLIPDMVPVFGYLDELVLIPLAVSLAIKMMPLHLLSECRDKASRLETRPVSRLGALVIVVLWLLVGVWILKRILTAIARIPPCPDTADRWPTFHRFP